MGAGGNHQIIVVNDVFLADQSHPIVVWLDQLNIREDDLDSRREEIALGLNYISLVVDAKRDEQEAGLVVMVFILVNDDDAPIGRVKIMGHFVCNHGAAGSGAKDEKCFHSVLRGVKIVFLINGYSISRTA